MLTIYTICVFSIVYYICQLNIFQKEKKKPLCLTGHTESEESGE